MSNLISSNEITIDADTTVVANKPVQILHCQGYIDATTFDQFQEAILHPTEPQQHNLVLDMSGITYVYSSGYGLLLTAQRQAQAGGGNLVVAGLEGKVNNIFHLLGFDRVINTFPTVEAALESFR